MRRAYRAMFSILIFSSTFIGILLLENRLQIGEREESGKNNRSGALEALDFWTRSRAYPDNDIPADRYYRAYQTAKTKMREVSNVLSAGSIWDPIGPLNLQGRTISVALNPTNPSTVYIGTASGGLWRSYTGGLGGDWQQVKLGYPALGISSIVINPIDTNTMYLGTGEVYSYQTALGGLVIRTTRGSYGIGILKTTDGGNTWTKSLDWSYNQQSGVQKLTLNPLNPNTIWAATTEGIYKSLDAGASWNYYYGISMVNDIIVHLTDTNKVMFTAGNFTQSFVGYTTNGGNDWYGSPLPTYSGKILLAIYPPYPNVVYASAADSTTGVGALYRSTDFGVSWIKLNQFTGTGGLYGVQGWYSHYVAVHPQDSSIIVLNSVGRAKSTNGGKTFTYISSGYSDNHSYAVHPTNPNILYAVNDDGVYRSTDFGSSYTNIGFGLQTGQIYNGFSCSTTDSLIALSQSQDHIPGYRYLGSTRWDHGSAVDEAGWTAIDPTNDNIMYAVDRFGGYVYKSVDRGATFSYMFGFGGNGAWNSPIVICPANTNVLYFGEKRIFKSINAAGSWTATNGGASLDGNPTLSMAISATNPDTVYVGTAPISVRAHIYRTTNGGTTWTNMTGTLPNKYPIDMAVDPANSKIVYVTFGGFGVGHLYKSTDAGTTWTDITGTLPDIPTTAVVIDPLHQNVVYVGNDFGVYVSTDGGGSWSAFSEGLPDAVIVADLVISPSNRALRVATHGNGVWERKLLYELPGSYFDYKALTVTAPADGSLLDVGSPITALHASFRNISAQTKSDSFYVKYRILLGTQELFTSTKHIAPLISAEIRTVTFDGNFTPTTDGTYTAQAITLAADDNSSNDTTEIAFNAVFPSNVSYWTVTKTYSPYSNIVGGSPGPSGDDVYIRKMLPFIFTYDNHPYDSIIINTNGWLEFGAGTRGSLFGLSTNSQIGNYFTPTLATADYPKKALGPWWTDLSANPGQITYTTTGLAPNRIFIVQWQNVPAYCCDPATTMTLNFQVKLHETTNLIEFCYGSVSGTLASYTGASIGLKDYAGGDNRFYDVYSHRTGLVGDLRTDLSPSVNWPGKDSGYVITTNSPGVTATYSAGWNLVSVPVTRNDHSILSLFPTSYPGTAFMYTTSYLPVDSMLPGGGYWIKLPSSISQLIVGFPMTSTSISLNTGWNIIGTVDHEVAAPSGGIITSNVYEFDGSGYNPIVALKPGKGFWVKASSAGTITLGPQAEPKIATDNIDANCTLIITDKQGRKQTLFLTEHPINFSRYELPPVPPAELFDARFTSQRMVESSTNELKGDVAYPIQMQSPVYPLTISYIISSETEKRYIIEELTNNKITASHSLSGEGKITITNGDERTIRVKVTGGKSLPTRYALQPNYPNPFNPSTTISFDLPMKSRVTLKVYDILGKEVVTLADGEYEAGSYAIHSDFSNLSSGVYLYRLKAGNYTEIKKMVFTK